MAALIVDRYVESLGMLTYTKLRYVGCVCIYVSDELLFFGQCHLICSPVFSASHELIDTSRS